MKQDSSYTTKPIQLPLSTEKEYVLVDVKGYLTSRYSATNSVIMKKKALIRPFKLSSVDRFNDGMVDGIDMTVIDASTEIELFREVIRQPRTNESIPVIEQEEEEFNTMSNNSGIPNPSWALYCIGDEVEKIKGSNWKGKVVGFYSTTLTPRGYAIESSSEKGSVQIYPESAIKPLHTKS